MTAKVQVFKSTQAAIEGFREEKTQYFMQIKQPDDTLLITMNVGKATYERIANSEAIPNKINGTKTK